MLIDGKKLIEQQLKITGKTEMVFDDGRCTTLVPVRYTPQPQDSAVILDGDWQVLRWPFAKPETDLVSPAVDDRSWETVRQPGKVFYADPEAEKEPIPNWDRVTQSHIHSDDGAVMRRTVAIPQSWKSKRIYLRFDSIYPAGRVYLNGKLLGEHLSGLTPVEFDITGNVVPGRDALVAVRLLRKHKHLQMDMARHGMEFAGLAQSVTVFCTEQVQVADYHLFSGLNDTLTQGTVKGMVRLRNHGAATTGELTVKLTAADNRTVVSQTQPLTLAAGCAADLPVRLDLANPLLWNDEYPNLYTVSLELKVESLADQEVSFRTGFRRLDLKPSGPTLNGRFIKFRGINFLTFNPESGLHTPREWLRRNLLLMKKANINAIRTHYLGCRDLADLCDETGIYLLQELPIDWGTHYIHDPDWVGPALLRIEGGIRRDRHHPSVMVWSVGNENMPESAAVAEDGWNHLRIYDRFCKTLDPSRPTMFPPPGPANKIEGIFELRVGDIADIHYSFTLQKQFRTTGRVKNPHSWEADMEEITREQALARGWSGVWFSSEYALVNHQMDLLNNPYLSVCDDVQEDVLSGRNSLQVFMDRISREWGNMREDPACLGGAYFPWLCAGSGNNPWGWVRWGEDADWAVITADLLPKPGFWALRVAFSPVKFPDRVVWKKGEDFFTLTLTNHYNAIDFKDCVLRTQQNVGGKWMGMARQFRDVSMQGGPGETVSVRVPIWNRDMRTALEADGYGLCRCFLLDPSGFRPITADVLVLSENMKRIQDGLMPLGPDAVL